MIRQMRRGDWDGMMAIYRQSLEKGTVTFNTECPSYEEWDGGHIRACRLIYEQDGQVAGYAALSPLSARKAYAGVADLCIYVDERRHRKGVGKALLNALCREAEKLGYWTLCATVFSINTPSLELHKSCGFRVIGQREDVAKDRFGNWQSTTILERRNGIR